MSGDDTIFAVSSGVGRAAIAIIRLSGPKVRFALETMAGGVPRPRRASLKILRRPGDGAVLDQALVLFFPGPASETGEDIAELQVHGGRAVVASVLATLGALPGLRPAEPGEFARRALFNGKMDLLDVEALADLIDADTEAQRRQAVEGGGSLLRGRAEGWRERLLDLRAELETEIDFSDEGDVQAGFDSQARRMLSAMTAEIDAVLASARRGERVREGFRVVIAGRPNAGKSSLLNALARRDVAIVSDVPGTTRDRIDVFLDLHGVPVHITDTAGLHDTEDAVEREGMRRSRVAMAEADLVLWLVPADVPAVGAEAVPPEAQLIRTKTDLVAGAKDREWAVISIHDRNSIDALLEKIEGEARERLCLGEPVAVTRERQRLALMSCRDALGRAIRAFPETELMAEDVRLATLALERLVGRVDVEDVLGAIFSRFCIGK